MKQQKTDPFCLGSLLLTSQPFDKAHAEHTLMHGHTYDALSLPH